MRHIKFIDLHKNEVPKAFSENISLESHQKAADYTIAKARLSFASIVIDLALLLLLTFGGGIKLLDAFTLEFFDSPVYRGVFFLVLLVFISSLSDLPVSLYKTFIIETQFGFNKTTFKTWTLDLIKNTIVAITLGLPLLWAIIVLMELMGDQWWLYVWLLMMSFIGLVQFIGPTYIAPLFNKFTIMEDGDLKTRVELLLQKCGFSSSGLFVMDGSKRSSHGNAYFTGFGNNKRIVFFDTLLERLGVAEIEAVLAHELGHFKLKHVLKRLGLMALTSLIFLAILGFVKNEVWFFNGLNVDFTSNNGVVIGLFFLIVPVFTFILQPFLSKMSRVHEFEADEYAAQFTPAKDLISALVKLYNDNAATLTPDPVYSSWYDSHPPAAIRISKLETLIKI